MIFNVQNKLPKVRLRPYRKHVAYISEFYFNNKSAIMLGYSIMPEYNKLVVAFKDILVIIKSQNKNYLKLLFGMLYNHTINLYKDIVSNKIHGKIHNILEQLYDTNDEFKDEETHITISDKGIIAYLVKETQILCYKYTKHWHKDNTINLLRENQKLEEEDHGKFINDRYYVFYKQFLDEVENDDDYEDEEDSYKLEQKEETDLVKIYDLHTGNLIHEAMTCSYLQDGYYRPFEFISIDYPIPFFMNDEIVLRPVALVLDDCGMSLAIIKSKNGDKITRNYPLGEDTKSIVAFFHSDNNSIALTESDILLYDTHNNLTSERNIDISQKIDIPHTIDINKCLYYKRQNFLVIYDGKQQFIAIYYCAAKSKYYYELVHFEKHILGKIVLVGYITSTHNPSDCIGLVLYSLKGMFSVIAYDSHRDRIKYEQTQYNVIGFNKESKISLLKVMIARWIKNNYTSKLLDEVSFLKQFNGIYKTKEDADLDVIIGDRISAFMKYYSSPIQLQVQQHYNFENMDSDSRSWEKQVEDCNCIYEQPCLVKLIDL
jgi:hypothetical protein